MGLNLNLGSGKRDLVDFINIDAVKQTDMTVVGDILHLAYADGSVDKIFSEHVFEHLDRADGERFFSECSRMLKQGGDLEIIVPCWRTWINRYVKGEIDMITLDMFLYGPQLHPYDFHRSAMYNEKLTDLCNRHGFNMTGIWYQDRPHSAWEIHLTAVKL
jgi:predicted SAM-dependent methyltransferase